MTSAGSDPAKTAARPPQDTLAASSNHHATKSANEVDGSARPNEVDDSAPTLKENATSASDHASSQYKPNTPTQENGVHEGHPSEPASPADSRRSRQDSDLRKHFSLPAEGAGGVSEWSHQQVAVQEDGDEKNKDPLGGWQTMPSYADWDMFDDDGKMIAQAHPDSDNERDTHAGLGGAGRGYTKVDMDEDAKSTTSMDDNTAYLFKTAEGKELDEDEDEEGRDPLEQMQATKNLLNDNQKIAYVGLVRLAMADMLKALETIDRTRGTRKQVDLALEAFMMWTQKMMLRLYGHMELDQAEQVMIEQLSEHGLRPSDLTPSLMENARVNNPMQNADSSTQGLTSKEEPGKEAQADGVLEKNQGIAPRTSDGASADDPPSVEDEEAPPKYEEHDLQAVQLPSELPTSEKIDIDLRWTVLCDVFLVLIADSMYDARSRALLEKLGSYLQVSAHEICRFEKRVTDALEMQEEKEKEKWNEDEHIETRRKLAKRRRLMMMGLATAGGTLVIGLSGGLLGPLIGAGLAAGFTAIGVSGTSGFLAGAAGAAIVGTGSAVAGGAMGAKASHRRTGAVTTFEYRPLYNNKRVNLILTIAGWLNGKVDDPRLPFSTIDPIMGDLYSLWWEPEMLTSMGQTLTILATEALTQALQQVLASTFLTPLMGALQVPIILGKLTYLVDNPWSVSVARADRAGLILADSLVDRNLGARPITLVGFSIGSRVIFAALQELAKRGAVGLIQNVFLFGSPMVAKKDDYLKARTVVAGRFVNGYSTTDWILSYLFRATSGGVMRVAGLANVDFPGIENFNVTEWVNGHMAYRKAMPKLLREVGFLITSEEFSEIEDPDPDNHEARQRQLIDEIEEARKEIHETKDQDKKGWKWFKRKRAAEKLPWEIYDERSQKGNDTNDMKGDPDGVLFDVEAIKQEVVELGAQGLEIKQLESTMPTLKLDSDSSGATAPQRPVDNLRGTKSDLSLPIPKHNFEPPESSRSLDYNRNEVGLPTHKDDEEISMTFDSGNTRPASSRTPSDWGSVPDPTDRGKSTTQVESAAAAGPPGLHPMEEKNVWGDDDEFQEKEMEMSFA
ncbi:MAG: hypothetical protein Q9159_007095 [Coniocarpon cinnabarinum]